MKFKSILLVFMVTMVSLVGFTVASDTVSLQSNPVQLTTTTGQTAEVELIEEDGETKLVLQSTVDVSSATVSMWSRADKTDLQEIAFSTDSTGRLVALLSREDYADDISNFWFQVTITSVKGVVHNFEETELNWVVDASESSSSSTSITDDSFSLTTSTSSVIASSTSQTSSIQSVGETVTEASTSAILYRLYNADLKVHLYTKDSNEYQALGRSGWKQEGQAWQISTNQGTIVYRLYHPSLKVHLFTTDANEYAVLASRGWKQEGQAFRSYGSLPVYRLYNNSLQRHLYTTDANEYAVLAQRGWKQEGIAFYGLGTAATTKASGTLTISNIDKQAGTFDVIVSNVVGTSTIQSVQVPVWTDSNGQDDIKWYTATKQSDGTYKVTVDKANHKNGVGTYQVHLYYQYSSGSSGITSTKVNLPQTVLAGTISIQNQNQAKGTFDVVVTGVASPNGVASVQVPVWSETGGQDDIIWYTATKQSNGTYKVTVESRNHKYSTGTYHFHLYIKDGSGQTVGITSTTTSVTITQVKPEATIAIKNINNVYGFFEVVVSDIFAPAGVDKVMIPVWSSVNGQNDIAWYTATKQSNGTYTASVRVANHQYETGTYNAHLYITSGGKQYGVGSTTASVTYQSKTIRTFIDVSSHNGSLSVTDYRNMMAQGVSGVVVKLTEATSYRNPYAAEQIRNAQAAGLKVSVYHYSHFTDEAGAQAEARYFVAMAKELGLPTNTVMVNDIEEWKTRTNINTNMKAWEAEMKRLGYSNLVHYTGASWIDKSGLGTAGPIITSQFGLSNFWIAQYPYSYNPISVDQASSLSLHSGAAAWQFTSVAQLLVGRSYFDLNLDYTGRFTN
ncbi:TPA: GBS Bsp-like repeat-containing protein [Streptococcus suis]